MSGSKLLEPRRFSRSFDYRVVDPYIKDLFTGANAAVMVVVIDGIERLVVLSSSSTSSSSAALGRTKRKNNRGKDIKERPS